MMKEKYRKLLYACGILVDKGLQEGIVFRGGIKGLVVLLAFPLTLFKIWKNRQKQRRIDSTAFKYKLAMVAIAKNEADYISEWLCFHKLQGVERVFLYDNESTDGMKSILQPYIDDGFVVYHLIQGKGKQMEAYNDALRRYGDQCKYMAVIDCDEFLLPVDTNETLIDVIDKTFEKDRYAGGIGVNWCLYGSSGIEEKSEGLVIERFLNRAQASFEKNVHIKSIVKPQTVKTFRNPHSPQYQRGFYAIDMAGNLIGSFYHQIASFCGMRINHYFCKSKQEWIDRRKIGRGDKVNVVRKIDDFYEHDRNDVYDDLALKYVSDVKNMMQNYSCVD